MSVNKITDPVTPNDLINKGNEIIDQLNQINSSYMTENDVDAMLADYIPEAQKGAANGVASLGSDGKVPSDQLPASTGGSKTTWYGTSNTAAGTAAKVVTCSGFTLEAGAIIAVLFTTANTAATPTLNVNSTGAKTIYAGSGTLNGTTNVLKWSANTVMVFMYDGTYFRYITSRAAASVVPPDGAGSWYGTCSTGANTAAKTSTIENFRLMPGAVVHITFSNYCSLASALSLNINSTGAKTIYYNNAATSASNPLTWVNGETLTFVYSGSYYYFVGRSKPTVSKIEGSSGSIYADVMASSEFGVFAEYVDEDTGAMTAVTIGNGGILIGISDADGNDVEYALSPTTSFETPTITSGYVTIVNGGYYVEGKRCYVQMRVQLTSNLAANSGLNVMSGLPAPAEVAAAVLAILANNRGGHGARVTSGGAIQIIADADHGITAGQNIDLTGVYTIQ